MRFEKRWEDLFIPIVSLSFHVIQSSFPIFDQVGSQTKLFSGVSEAKDSLIAVNEKCKAMSKDRLVREVVAAPEPTCILATDQQLADLDRFCCAPRPCNAILGIDPTFSLGDFYVTCTVYCHSGMNNKEGKLCLFHGPMFIHQRKLYESSCTASSLALKFTNSHAHITI